MNKDSSGGTRRELAILRLWEAYNLLGDEEDAIRMLVELALIGLARRRSDAPPPDAAARERDDG